jgi:hypothetical protein
MTAGGEHATAGVESSPASVLWSAIDDLLARATVAGVLAHRLGPLGAARMRRLGTPLPDELRAEERASVLGMRTGVALVERIRDSYDGPLVLLKGPEVARLYPGHARRFGDIDVLTDDAARLDRRMREHGFVESFDPGIGEDHHHLQPLRLPAISLTVEIHSSPSWLPSMRPPPLDEILEAAVPSALGVEGVAAPSPLHHTLILATHAWKSEPLRALRDLVDIAAVGASVDRTDLDRTAAAWGIRRVWQTTSHAIDRMFYGGSRSFPLRTWARHLEDVRERSVFEDHLCRWLSPFSELPPRRAIAGAVQVFADELRPAAGETRREKLGRTARALRSPAAPVVRRRRRPDDGRVDSR